MKVIIDGLVVEEPKTIITYGVEEIKSTTILYKRTSGREDKFVVNYSNGLYADIHEGDFIKINGELRSRIEKDGEIIYSTIYIFANNIEQLSEEPEKYENSISIDKAEVITQPEIRKIEDGKPTIVSFSVAVKRKPNRVSKIYCVTWNTIANLSCELTSGVSIGLYGRLQSSYSKFGRLRTAISIISIDKIYD